MKKIIEEDRYFSIIKEEYEATFSYKRVNRTLFRRYLKEKTVENRNALLVQNIFLSRRVARDFMKAFEVPEMYYEDVVSAGIEGMLRSMEKPGWEKYVSSLNPSLYLYWSAKKEIRRWILENKRATEIKDYYIDIEDEVNDEVEDKDMKDYYIWKVGAARSWLLREKENLIIQKAFFEEVSYEEISYLPDVNCSRERVRQLVEIAIRKLRVVFERSENLSVYDLERYVERIEKQEEIRKQNIWKHALVNIKKLQEEKEEERL